MLPVHHYMMPNLREFASSKAVIDFDFDGIQPESGFVFGCLYVNMGRFIVFITVKEKPVTAYSEDRRHALIVQQAL